MDGVGNLIAFYPRGGPLAQGLDTEGGAKLGNDDNVNRFSKPLVRNADAKGAHDVWMFAKQILDLQRCDLVAAARDDLFDAPDNLDPPVRAHAHKVSSPEETLGKRGTRQSGIVEITKHHEGRVNLQLPWRTRRCGLAVWRHHAKGDLLGWRADRAPSVRLIRGREAEVTRGGLGQAVEIVDGGARKGFLDCSCEPRRKMPRHLLEPCATRVHAALDSIGARGAWREPLRGRWRVLRAAAQSNRAKTLAR